MCASVIVFSGDDIYMIRMLPLGINLQCLQLATTWLKTFPWHQTRVNPERVREEREEGGGKGEGRRGCCCLDWLFTFLAPEGKREERKSLVLSKEGKVTKVSCPCCMQWDTWRQFSATFFVLICYCPGKRDFPPSRLANVPEFNCQVRFLL